MKNSADGDPHETAGEQRIAMAAALTCAHAAYRKAMQEAQRAGEAADRRAALVEARRLMVRATRLRSRLRQELP